MRLAVFLFQYFSDLSENRHTFCIGLDHSGIPPLSGDGRQAYLSCKQFLLVPIVVGHLGRHTGMRTKYHDHEQPPFAIIPGINSLKMINGNLQESRR